MTADTQRIAGREFAWATALGIAAAAAGCIGEPLVLAAAIGLALAAVAGLWILNAPRRWVILFLVSALCLPPLPLALGDSGPHVALALAAIGLVAGALRWREWRHPLPLVSLALPAYTALMLASIPLAAAYSGVQLALVSLARVGLFAISVYLFFYVAGGPGTHSEEEAKRSTRFLYAAGVVSAIFACVDFYFQFPALGGFGPQYIWLDSGTYRRAQGVFYEASTLGNMCVFFLLLLVVSLARGRGPVRRVWMLWGAVPLVGALLLSYSRGSVINLGVSLAVLALLSVRELRFARVAAVVTGGCIAALAAIYAAVPVFVEFYWLRIETSVRELLQGNERLLSGRVETWRTLLGFLWEHPEHALFGVGYKTLPYSDFIGSITVADNAYLSSLVETGLLGLAALLLMHGAILAMAWRARAGANETASLLGTWIFCFWCGEMVQMLSGDLLTYWRVLPVYLGVLGIAVGLSRRPNNG